MPSLPRSSIACLVLASAAGTCGASEDIAFIAEHLPEVAMDNRYASLPLETSPAHDAHGWHADVALGFTRIQTAHAELTGPLLSLAAVREHGASRWTFLVFHDPLEFGGSPERRPLDEPFAPTPLALPVAAQFGSLGGTARDTGAGIVFSRSARVFGLGDVVASIGLLWQRVQLEGFRTDYRLLDGPQAGATGSIDFSSTYEHVVPLLDIGKSFGRGDFQFDPHLRIAVPMPRRAFAGRISGPGFDVSGNTAEQGAGYHFGDPSVTLGFDVTYRPWNLSVDAGAVITQAFVEPVIHEGVTNNWMLAVRWSPR